MSGQKWPVAMMLRIGDGDVGVGRVYRGQGKRQDEADPPNRTDSYHFRYIKLVSRVTTLIQS